MSLSLKNIQTTSPLEDRQKSEMEEENLIAIHKLLRLYPKGSFVLF